MTSVIAVATEMMNVAGGHINVFVRTDNEDVDDDWDEDSNPTYENPVDLKGYFVPQPLEQELTKWGVDQINPVEVVFLRSEVYSRWNGRLLRSGDILEIPFNSATNTPPKYYKVNNAQETGNYRFVWLYVKCQCTLITGDPNIRPHTDAVEEPAQET